MTLRLIGKVSFVIWQLVQLPLVLGLFIFSKALVNKAANGWVISGHRGRIKADNSASLFDFVSQHTRQPITWIGEHGGATSSTFPEAEIVPKHTLRARLLIARAPVLIYSHGEDDLDCLLFLLRPFVGKRVYIGHGSNLLKRGFMHPSEIASQGILRAAAINWLSDYDLMICSSDEEKKFWDENQPQRKERHFVCSGAPRLDAILPLADLQQSRTIVYAPTFRENKTGNQILLQKLKSLTDSTYLENWLEEKDFQLIVVFHINTLRSGLTIPSRKKRILFASPDQLWEALSTAACLVTDYSSIVIDWLLFDRPAVFFPFDLHDFMKTRGFHQPYDGYIYGEVANSLDELVEILTGDTWRDNLYYRARRHELRTRFFPTVDTCNSLNVYKTICRLSGCRPEIVAGDGGGEEGCEKCETTKQRQT